MRIVCHNTDGKHEGKQRQDIDADPGRYQANVLINETMMGREGINVLLKSCKKKYTTRITSRMAMTNVSTTLWMEAKRKSFVLIIYTNSGPAGRFFDFSSILAVMAALTSVALLPATWKMRNVAPGCPSTSP